MAFTQDQLAIAARLDSRGATSSRMEGIKCSSVRDGAVERRESSNEEMMSPQIIVVL
jgi:hypothetical protein